VLHGGTGLSDEQYRTLIANGIAKINYYTALADCAGDRVQRNAEAGARGYTAMLAGVKEAVERQAGRCMRLWGAAGRADQLLQLCTPWRPVQHLIIYNSSVDDASKTAQMMAEGRRILAAIPGVREVFTGSAVQQGARYRYSWLVHFCHPAVIDSYREHPDHVAFADGLFRPLAGDRISIDYQET
jgi:fructose-bisphosphate aldolase class II